MFLWRLCYIDGQHRRESDVWRKPEKVAEGKRTVPAGGGPAASCGAADGVQMGAGSFPKLKILINPTLTFAQPIQPEGWITRKGGMRPVEGEHTAFSCGGFQRGLPPFGTLLCLQSVVCYTCWRG